MMNPAARHVQVLATAGAGKEVFLCGHSLGGALAAMLALSLPARCADCHTRSVMSPW